MYSFGKVSTKNRDECEAGLQQVLNGSIIVYNFSVVCGHRGEVAQNRAHAAGFSTVKFPFGKHNKMPSEAFDIYPYHKKYGCLTGHHSQVIKIADELGMTLLEVENWITQEFCVMAGVVLATAAREGITIRWGGDWDGDGDRLDQKFDDLAHFERG